MFETVLFPTDPQEIDDGAMDYAIELANEFDSALHVVSVTEAGQRRDQLRTDREEEAKNTVATILKRAEDRDLEADGDVRAGMPHEEILGKINDADADLVVMGTQARSGLDRLLLGSVAESVIRESPVPVLTVTPEADPTDHS